MALNPRSPVSDYDQFAEVYEAWTEASEAAHASAPFYLEEYAKSAGPAVELGVGTGRIALEAVARGLDMIGVDNSTGMLERCRTKAAARQLDGKLQLIEADFGQFQLPFPADLIALPYHSIGHVTDPKAKGEILAHVFSQLAPGGRFIFDDFFYRPELEQKLRRVELKAELKHPSTQRDMLLWVTSVVEPEQQRMRMVTWTDELDDDGVLGRRQYRRLWLSWLEPSQWSELLEKAGFVVEACYGDFDRTPFDASGAVEQIWIARKS